jgi:hypothetical protein
MNIMTLCMGALAFSLTGGAALAAGNGSSALDNSEMMKPFYTDATMKTMVPEEQFKAAWMKMSQTDQAAVMKECSDAAIAKEHDNFCAMTKQLGGAN